MQCGMAMRAYELGLAAEIDRVVHGLESGGLADAASVSRQLGCTAAAVVATTTSGWPTCRPRRRLAKATNVQAEQFPSGVVVATPPVGLHRSWAEKEAAAALELAADEGECQEANKKATIDQIVVGPSDMDNKHCHMAVAEDILQRRMPISDDVMDRAFYGSGKPFDKEGNAEKGDSDNKQCHMEVAEDNSKLRMPISDYFTDRAFNCSGKPSDKDGNADKDANKKATIDQIADGTSDADNKNCHMEVADHILKRRMPISDDFMNRAFNGSGNPINKDGNADKDDDYSVPGRPPEACGQGEGDEHLHHFDLQVATDQEATANEGGSDEPCDAGIAGATCEEVCGQDRQEHQHPYRGHEGQGHKDEHRRAQRWHDMYDEPHDDQHDDVPISCESPLRGVATGDAAVQDDEEADEELAADANDGDSEEQDDDSSSSSATDGIGESLVPQQADKELTVVQHVAEKQQPDNTGTLADVMRLRRHEEERDLWRPGWRSTEYPEDKVISFMIGCPVQEARVGWHSSEYQLALAAGHDYDPPYLPDYASKGKGKDKADKGKGKDKYKQPRQGEGKGGKGITDQKGKTKGKGKKGKKAK